MIGRSITLELAEGREEETRERLRVLGVVTQALTIPSAEDGGYRAYCALFLSPVREDSTSSGKALLSANSSPVSVHTHGRRPSSGVMAAIVPRELR